MGFKRTGAILPLLLAAGMARADLSPSTILGKVSATRAQGMGGAAGAIIGDPDMIWANPAASYSHKGMLLTMEGQKGIFGQGMGQVLFVKSWKGRPEVVSLGASYEDTGSVVMQTVEGMDRRISLQKDVLLLLGVTLGEWTGKPYGIALKALRSEVLGQYTANAVMLDAGLQGTWGERVKYGAAIQNLGTRLRYLQTAYNLPACLRAGVSTEWKWGGRMLAGADVDYSWNERLTGCRAGAEYTWAGIAAIRAGAKVEGLKGFSYSAGLGVLAGRYRLDYSLEMGGDIGYPQSLGITIAF